MPVSKEVKPILHPSQWLWLTAAVFPGLPVALFYGLKSRASLMEAVFRGFTVPAGARLAQWTSPLPFSLGEALGILLVLWGSFSLLRGLWLFAMKGKGLRPLLKSLGRLAILLLWLWAAFCWLWNIAYWVPGFAASQQIQRREISLPELTRTASYLAGILTEEADAVDRDEAGLFDHPAEAFFPLALSLYDPLEEEFPDLKIQDALPKKLLLSKLQSRMGFSGFYSPFTGEANINTDIPLSAQPFAIAHELAHQRFVASEDEADFLGVAACLSSDIPLYRYSGALSGLKFLAGPLVSRDPQAWQAIAASLPPGAVADWNRSIEYWAQFKTPLEEWSRDAYDGYLKSQGQAQGIGSYGACVDLLVYYYSSEILENPYSE